MATRFRWTYDELTPNLDRLAIRLLGALQVKLGNLADEIETYMVENAPWEDRTGEARDGLRAELDASNFVKPRIVLYHTVDYGLFLEVRWSGRYAIIVPTMELFGRAMMEDLNGLLEDL